MKIGDEVFVHGYIDEIRNDVVIIKNAGRNRGPFKFTEDRQQNTSGRPLGIYGTGGPMIINNNGVIRRVIDVYGHKHQTYVASEELGELNQQLMKELRGIGNHEHLVEEYADVVICLLEIQEMYNITEAELQDAINEKLARLESRLNERIA